MLIRPVVLRWALERSGKAQEELERRFPKLAAWLQGSGGPTLRQAQQLAAAVGLPLGYLLLPEPPEERLALPFLRTREGNMARRPSPELLETVRVMQWRQDWLREYRRELGHSPLAFVGSARPGADPGRLALRMRAALGLAAGWAAGAATWEDALRTLRERMEEAGVTVCVSGIVGNNTRRALRVAEFRGFVLVDGHAPWVFVNGADAKAAQMFTLAHELAHLWYGVSAAFDLAELQPAGDAAERRCDAAAAEFLVPARELAERWPAVARRPDRWQRLARTFKVSALAAARRALDLELVSREEFRALYREYLRREQGRGTTQSGGNFYATQRLRLGRSFAAAVVRAAREGSLLYREAYQLTGLYGRTFEEFTLRMGEPG